MTDCAARCHDGQDEPTPAKAHAALCAACDARLARDLRRLPALDHALNVLAIIAASPGNGTVALPFDPDAAEWQSWFRRNVTRVTRDVAEERKWPLPRDHPWAMCAWLEPQVSWMSYHDWAPAVDWAPRLADAFRRGRNRGEQLAAPLLVKHVFLPGSCLDCGNGRMQAVIYADHHAGRWSYWVCPNPECGAVTPMEFWWDYPKRRAAMQGQVAG